MNVSDTQGAKVLKKASRQLENNETNLQAAASMASGMQPSPEQAAAATSNLYAITVQSARIVEQARPDEQIKEVGDIMRSKVDQCLLARGYVRFRLTPEQRTRLQHLHLGSPERHDYLFHLGTDPEVLQAQKY
ncbi:hypothetical protein [Sphingomonas crusticola]|uniref:hypothetical protein n=1 Tax=Sphingomonas crusticola TaxID=1697973 RepID=UPI001F07ABB8|nr:hypothetical protein [Sphingomonas crusticola]